MIGKSIRIYLPDATVTGIRYAELVNWTGHAIACPRKRLNELKDWSESSKPGIYFLFEGRFGNSKPVAYIGESENVFKRITEQDRDKEFWSELVIFTSKDANLTKAHIKYLESSLVLLSKKADRFDLMNGNTPTESSLPRADQDGMEEYINNVRMVLGTLGYTILEPFLQSNTSSNSVSDSYEWDDNVLSNLTFRVNNLTAAGAVTDEGFVLKKDSQLSKTNSESMPGKLLSVKERLLIEGKLNDEGDHLISIEDIPFNSSSYAAAIVAGTSRSGPQSWKTLKGITLKKIEEDKLDNL